MTKNKTRIIEFPSKTGTSSHPVIKDGIGNFDDYEEYEDEEYFYLLEEKDYPGLIQYCKNRATENPGDLYAKANLGNAYILKRQL